MTLTHTSFSFLFPCLLLHDANWPNVSTLRYDSFWCIWLILIDSFPSDSFLLTPGMTCIDSYWLILNRTDSYWLIFSDYIWLILVQVLVVMADLSVYKNPQNPSCSSLPLSSSFTSEYNISCLAHCPLVWIPSTLILALVYLSVGDHLEVLLVVL